MFPLSQLPELNNFRSDSQPFYHDGHFMPTKPTKQLQTPCFYLTIIQCPNTIGALTWLYILIPKYWMLNGKRSKCFKTISQRSRKKAYFKNQNLTIMLQISGHIFCGLPKNRPMEVWGPLDWGVSADHV